MLFGSVTGGPKELYIRWGSDPPKRSGKFLGLSNPLINTVSHCSGVCCKKSTASARQKSSYVSNGLPCYWLSTLVTVVEMFASHFRFSDD